MTAVLPLELLDDDAALLDEELLDEELLDEELLLDDEEDAVLELLVELAEPVEEATLCDDEALEDDASWAPPTPLTPPAPPPELDERVSSPPAPPFDDELTTPRSPPAPLDPVNVGAALPEHAATRGPRTTSR